MRERRILLLDDDRSRITAFVTRIDDVSRSITPVETAESCIQLLASTVWDLVLLDHDLGGETFVDSARSDTGAEVVRWLRSNQKPHGAFVVHSMNPVGAASMYFDLAEMGYKVTQAPFGSQDFWGAVYTELGVRAGGRTTRQTLSQRIAAYLRSIRRGGSR